MKPLTALVCGVIGFCLGLVLAYHIVTSQCKSQMWFNTATSTFLCKPVEPFK